MWHMQYVSAVHEHVLMFYPLICKYRKIPVDETTNALSSFLFWATNTQLFCKLSIHKYIIVPLTIKFLMNLLRYLKRVK